MKKELSKLLEKHCYNQGIKYTAINCEEIVHFITEEMTNILIRDKELLFSSVGKFIIKEKLIVNARNTRTNQKLENKKTNVLKFKMSDCFKNKINQ